MPVKTVLFLGDSGTLDAEKTGADWVERVAAYGWQNDLWTVKNAGIPGASTHSWVRILDEGLNGNVLNLVPRYDFVVLQLDPAQDGLTQMREEDGTFVYM